MITRFHRYMGVFLLMFFPSLFIFPGDIEMGRKLFKSCATCHGINGEGNQELQAPRLTEQQPWYLKKQLIKFREKQRGYTEKEDRNFLQEAVEHRLIHGTSPGYLENDPYSRLMHPLVGLITDKEIECLINFLATLKVDKKVDTFEGDPQKGKELFVSCSRCHGMNAQGDKKLEAPKLTNQHGWYLFEQLKDFQMGWRGTQPKDLSGQKMRENFDKMSDHVSIDLNDQAMKDLIAYIHSLDKVAEK